MGSLGVESLFTNIPLDETIDLLTEKVFQNKVKVKGISKRDFKCLLAISTKGTVFYFNGKYFQQRNGVAMGSPLGPDCVAGELSIVIRTSVFCKICRRCVCLDSFQRSHSEAC